MRDWVGLFDIMDIGALVPAAFSRYRPAVAGALGFFLRELPADRAFAILAEQAALPADAGPEQRLVAVARHSPALHKLGQVLARDRRLPPGFRALLQGLEAMPAALGPE